jgi:hypothetical protein
MREDTQNAVEKSEQNRSMKNKNYGEGFAMRCPS